MDGKWEIPDTLCVKRWFNAHEEMLVLSATRRYLEGPLCANKLQKMCCGAQVKLPDSSTLRRSSSALLARGVHGCLFASLFWRHISNNSLQE